MRWLATLCIDEKWDQFEMHSNMGINILAVVIAYHKAGWLAFEMS